MGEEYEIVDRYGRPTGERARRVDTGGGCLGSPLLLIGVLVIVLIAGGVYGVNSLSNWIQSNNLPIHDSLRNIQLTGNNSGSANSDSDGLHLTDGIYFYSGIKYGDVDVSVTVRLTGYLISNTVALAAYGLDARDSVNSYDFEITPDGRWLHEVHDLAVSTPNGTPESAIKKGIGAINTLEVRMHGTHAAFLVNGVIVDEEDFPGSATSGGIAFEARNLLGDPPNSISAVFTNLTINRDG